MRVTDLLRVDHQRVHDLFLEAETTTERNRRRELLDMIGEELELHAQAEEEIVYPAFHRVSRGIDDARQGHQHMRRLIGEVRALDPGVGEFSRRLLELKQAVLVHVIEEEGGIFVDAAALGHDELERLGRQVEARKKELRASVRQRAKRVVKPPAQKIA
jgi:hypothetical protein